MPKKAGGCTENSSRILIGASPPRPGVFWDRRFFCGGGGGIGIGIGIAGIAGGGGGGGGFA
jgi:hypothetical protein